MEGEKPSMIHVANLFQKRNSALVLWMILMLAIMGGLTLPVHQVYAGSGIFGLPSLNDIGNSVLNAFITYFASTLLNIVTAGLTIIVIIIDVVLTLFEVLVGLFMSIIIGWVTTVPYTPINATLVANPNNAITVGWSVLRDLADMGLIFVLVAIAVATIIQIDFAKEGKWKGLFIKFVGIAILINFSPLLCGFLIDITNIFTKLFFGGVENGNAWKLFLSNNGNLAALGTLWNALSAIVSGDPFAGVSNLISAIIDIFFTLASITTFVTMSFILIARVLALWLLVILAPMAFLFYILPQTNSYFEKWWLNFWQWALIPIPLAFFFWLASTFKQNSGSLCIGGPNGTFGQFWGGANTIFAGSSFVSVSGTLSGGFLNDMCNPLMLMMAIGVLFAGFFISFSFSAIGARFIVTQGTKLGTWAGTTVAQGVGQLAGKYVGGGMLAAGAGTGRLAGRGAIGLGRGATGLGRKVGNIPTPMRARVLPFHQQKPGFGGAFVGGKSRVALGALPGELAQRAAATRLGQKAGGVARTMGQPVAKVAGKVGNIALPRGATVGGLAAQGAAKASGAAQQAKAQAAAGIAAGAAATGAGITAAFTRPHEALPLVKKGLEKMGEMKGVPPRVNATGKAMAEGVYKPAFSASFKATPTEGEVPLSVNFEDTSKGPITKRDWNFGDGFLSTLQNPTHVFTKVDTSVITNRKTGRSYTVARPKDYTVTLTITDTYGRTATTTKTITVNPGSGPGGTPPGAPGSAGGAGAMGAGPAPAGPTPPPTAGATGTATPGAAAATPPAPPTPPAGGAKTAPSPASGAAGATPGTPPPTPTAAPPQPQAPRPQSPVPSAAELYAAYQKQKTTELMIQLLASIALTSAETLRALKGTKEERDKFLKQRGEAMREILAAIKPSDVKVIINNPVAAESLSQMLHEILSGPDQEPIQQFVRNNEKFARDLVVSPAQELNLSERERSRLLDEAF